MDGNGSLFGTLQGNTREVLHKFTVDLPKKHGDFYYHSHLLCFHYGFLVLLKELLLIYISINIRLLSEIVHHIELL